MQELEPHAILIERVLQLRGQRRRRDIHDDLSSHELAERRQRWREKGKAGEKEGRGRGAMADDLRTNRTRKKGTKRGVRSVIMASSARPSAHIPM